MYFLCTYPFVVLDVVTALRLRWCKEYSRADYGQGAFHKELLYSRQLGCMKCEVAEHTCIIEFRFFINFISSCVYPSASPKPLPLSLVESTSLRRSDMLSRSLFDLRGFVRGEVAEDVFVLRGDEYMVLSFRRGMRLAARRRGRYDVT